MAATTQLLQPTELFPAVQAQEAAATTFQDTLNAVSGSPQDNQDNAASLIPASAPVAGDAGEGPAPKKANSNKAGFQTTALAIPDFSSLGRTPTKGDTRAFTGEDTDYTGLAGMAPPVDAATETVQGQLAALFENPDANPLWEYAKGIASQYANTRGLANSDIAAEAGAQAVFAQAMPIAQQDANTYAARAQQEAQFWQNAGLQAQAATIQSGLMAQAHMEQLVELDRQGDINSRLQLEQFGYNKELSAQDNMHKMQQLALQGDIQAELALQQFGFDTQLMKQDHGYRVNLMQIELRNALRIGEQNQSNALQQLDRQNRNTLQQIAANQANTLEQIAANGAQRLREIGAAGASQRETDAANNRARLDQIAASGAEQRRADEANNAARADQIAQQGQLDADRQASDEAARLDQIAAQGDEQSRINDEQFTQDLQQNYLSATERRTTAFGLEVERIWQNEGLTAAQQQNAINVARRNYITDLDFIASQYSSSPHWDPRWIIRPAGTPSGTPNAPPGTQPYQPPPPNPTPIIGPTNDYNADRPGGSSPSFQPVNTVGFNSPTAARTVSSASKPTGSTAPTFAPPPTPTVSLAAPPRASGTRIGGRATGGGLFAV